jgi:hypothetical protein
MANNTTLSNIYVEKASSEHPLALWMLNEQVDYITQITDSQRNFWDSNNWQVTNAAVTDVSGLVGFPKTPIENSSISKVSGAIPTAETQDITFKSSFTIPQANLSQELYNLSLGFYLYLETPLANSVSLGLSYTNNSSEEQDIYTELVVGKDRFNWSFFSSTFELPPTTATNIKLIVKVNVSNAEGAGVEDYGFFISGLSLGQWSEDFNKYSYGITPGNIPSDINLPSAANFKAIPAFPYGNSTKEAYYLSQGRTLSCKNFGIPLVFGSNNITKISPNIYNNVVYPSLIFPGYGFLNERGRHNDYTIEMWIKVNSSSLAPRKIFGPIASTDGLYADHGHLSFKVGNQLGSHFVGEWFRPMMIHIRVLTDSLIVLLNGEEIINLAFDQDSIVLPSELVNNKSQDWLGFYAYPDVDPIDVDTFSIYSYAMPTQVAKRHWVWGQAVAPPEQTNSSINAITAFNDYAFANYSANYNYPDFANWRQAFFSNVEAGSKILSLPEYRLPEFSLGTNTVESLYRDIEKIQPDTEDADDNAGIKYLTLKPNVKNIEGVSVTTGSITYTTTTEHNYSIGDVVSIYEIVSTQPNVFNLVAQTITNVTSDTFTITNAATGTYTSGGKVVKDSWYSDSHFIYFEKLAILNDPVETIYGIFKTDGTEINAPLFKITNKFNRDFLLVSLTGTTITYKITLSGTETTLSTKTVEVGKKFAAGLNIEKLLLNQNIDVSRFFSDKSTLEVFLAGDGTRKFSGKIYKFGFDAAYNNRKVSLFYDGDGVSIASSSSSNSMFAHTANYTLVSLNEYGLFFPDIAVAGYWEDYMPLSYFSKAVLDYEGNENYELDSIQFNLDFPEPSSSESVEVTGAWTYDDLKNEYSEPELLSYEILRNAYYTGWDSYEDMAGNTISTSFYNTSENIIKSFVSFQKVSDGANKNLVDFTNNYPALTSGVLDPEGIISTDWKDTAYEVVTGTVIYPPKKTYSGKPLRFDDYAIVYHLEFISNGILHHPIKLRELQLASQVLERKDFTPVGSKFGVPAYYYSRSGLYFDLKAKNPIATYKKSTPHLFLNRQSGWSIKGELSPKTDRGLSILVNQPRSQRTLVGSVQMWVRFYQKVFPSGPIMIFSINHKDGTIDFFLESDSSQKRGFIFGVDRDSLEILNDISYYLNGLPVNTPFLIKEEWAVLSLEFPSLLDFSGVSGRIDLNGPLVYNNISHTLATNIERTEFLETRIWSEIEEIGTWEYLKNNWKSALATWEDVKVISQSQIFDINSPASYAKYTGSDRIVIDDESSVLLFSPEGFTAYKEVSWANLIKIPA